MRVNNLHLLFLSMLRLFHSFQTKRREKTVVSLYEILQIHIHNAKNTQARARERQSRNCYQLQFHRNFKDIMHVIKKSYARRLFFVALPGIFIWHIVSAYFGCILSHSTTKHKEQMKHTHQTERWFCFIPDLFVFIRDFHQHILELHMLIYHQVYIPPSSMLRSVAISFLRSWLRTANLWRLELRWWWDQSANK